MTRVRRLAPRQALLIAGLVLAALNLRPALTSLSPLVAELRRDLGLSASSVSLLTTLPVLCFGLLAVLAPPLARRIGPERALAVSLLVVAAGTTLRGAGYSATLYLGMALAGTGIALGNVLVPTLIKRRFPHHAGPLTGVSTLAMAAGGALAAAATVPIEEAVGRGWPPALAVWGLPAVVAGVLWIPYALRKRADAVDGRATTFVALLRDRLAWQVTAFMGLQSLNFYVLISWLPAVYVSAGLSKADAGLLLSVVQLVGIPLTLVLPVLAARRPSQRPYAVGAVALTAAGMLGIILWPLAAPFVWAVSLGLGIGGMFALAFTFQVLRSGDSTTASQLSAMAQSIGYVLAATGPLAVGGLYDLTGGWTLPLGIVVALYVPLLLAGLGASAPRVVAGTATPRAQPLSRGPSAGP